MWKDGGSKCRRGGGRGSTNGDEFPVVKAEADDVINSRVSIEKRQILIRGSIICLDRAQLGDYNQNNYSGRTPASGLLANDSHDTHGEAFKLSERVCLMRVSVCERVRVRSLCRHHLCILEIHY